MSDDTGNAKITTSLKADGGAPWVVIRADSPQEHSQLVAFVASIGGELASATRTLQAAYSGQPAAQAPAPAAPEAPAASVWDAAPPAVPAGFGPAPSAPQSFGPPAGGNPSYGPPAQAPAAPQGGGGWADQPAGPVPLGDKSGLPMAWRTGNGDNGPWRGWMSSQPRDTPRHLKDKSIYIR